MTNSGFSRTALRIAWRELRASPAKFIFVVLAVAAGVGALTGVRGFSESFRSVLLLKARSLMAADITVNDFSTPTPAQQAELDRLEKSGIRVTRVSQTLTMAASANKPEPVMLTLKAVDPAAYPFYGTVDLSPPRPLAADLSDDQSVVTGEDVLMRTKTRIGDTLRIGGKDFRIAGVLVSEPDRLAGSFGMGIGLRAMVTRGGLERTGLILPGSRAPQRYLFRLPPSGPGVDETVNTLKKAFPEAYISDYRKTNPSISRGLDNATTFLSLVSLIALVVGALGVAMAMHAHLQQHMDGIAIMKSMGARSSQIVRIYAFETAILGIAGALLGIAAGYAVEQVFPHLISRYFSMQVAVAYGWGTVLQGFAIGLLTTMLFTVPPLLRIRRVRPIAILRRNMQEERKPWAKRWMESRPALAAGGVILAGMGAIAAWLSNSPKTAFIFVGGLVAGLLVLSGVAWLLLRALKLFLRGSSLHLHATVRHGIANLYRPGTQAQSVLVALGVGVMFTTTIFVVQRSIVQDLIESAPPGMPNVFLIDVQPSQKDGLMALLQKQPGVIGSLDIIPAVQMRLAAVNSVPVEKLGLKGWERRFMRTRAVTTAAALPRGVEVQKGSWWPKDSTAALVALDADAARTLRAGPGAELEFDALGRQVRARVAATYRSERFRMGGMSEFTFTPATLAGMPAIFYGGVQVKPGNVAGLQRAIYEAYPTVTVLSVADTLSLVQQVIDQIALVVRFLSAFAILAGVIILASSVAGTRFRRVREVVILKTLGGTRQRIANVFTIEFLILGSVAGLMGGLLANGFANLILKRSFDGAEVSFHPLVVLAAMAATALIADATGWLASFRILGQKPLEVLREE